MKKFFSFILVFVLVLSMSMNISMAKFDETGAKEIEFPLDVEPKDYSVRIGKKEYPIKNATILFVNGELLPKVETVSYTHLTLPTIHVECRSRWSPYH